MQKLQKSGTSRAEAARSWLSSIGSLPVAALGEAFYLTLLVLAAIQRFSPRSLPGLPDVFYFSSLLSVLYSAFLAIASAAWFRASQSASIVREGA